MLWLDDLDDLVFSGASAWETLRRLCLQIGLAAALMLAMCEVLANAATWAPGLAGVAASSVTVWAVGTLCVLVHRLEIGPRQTFA